MKTLILYLKDLFIATGMFLSIPFRTDLQLTKYKLKSLNDSLPEKRKKQLPYKLFSHSTKIIQLKLTNTEYSDALQFNMCLVYGAYTCIIAIITLIYRYTFATDDSIPYLLTIIIIAFSPGILATLYGLYQSVK